MQATFDIANALTTQKYQHRETLSEMDTCLILKLVLPILSAVFLKVIMFCKTVKANTIYYTNTYILMKGVP